MKWVGFLVVGIASFGNWCADITAGIETNSRRTADVKTDCTAATGSRIAGSVCDDELSNVQAVATAYGVASGSEVDVRPRSWRSTTGRAGVPHHARGGANISPRKTPLLAFCNAPLEGPELPDFSDNPRANGCFETEFLCSW